MHDALHGIITVLNTPFTETGALDLDGLHRNVRYAVEAGVAGFLMPALASEVAYLTREEKQAAVSAVVAETAGRAAVIGGASADDPEEQLYLAEDYLKLGCDGVLVQLAPDATAERLAEDLRPVAALGPRVLMLQDWDFEGSGHPLETIRYLRTQLEPFTWLKIEVQNAGPKYSEVLSATDLRVAGGWAVRDMIDGLDRGVHAFMPTGMHRTYVEIYRRFAQGDRAGAVALFEEIRPVLAFSNQGLDISIWFFKRLLHRQGIYATAKVRIPDASIEPAEVQGADELIDRVIQLESQLERMSHERA